MVRGGLGRTYSFHLFDIMFPYVSSMPFFFTRMWTYLDVSTEAVVAIHFQPILEWLEGASHSGRCSDLRPWPCSWTSKVVWCLGEAWGVQCRDATSGFFAYSLFDCTPNAFMNVTYLDNWSRVLTSTPWGYLFMWHLFVFCLQNVCYVHVFFHRPCASTCPTGSSIPPWPIWTCLDQTYTDNTWTDCVSLGFWALVRSVAWLRQCGCPSPAGRRASPSLQQILRGPAVCLQWNGC